MGFTDRDRALINELHGFYDTYALSTMFRLALRTKYYAAERLYLFGDIGVELEQDNRSGRFQTPRFFYRAGTGYDVSPNLNMELRTEQTLSSKKKPKPVYHFQPMERQGNDKVLSSGIPLVPSARSTPHRPPVPWIAA